MPDEALVCPGHGVYACLADGRPAAVSIGVRPTFNTGRGELIEAYMVDFEGDLYGSSCDWSSSRGCAASGCFETPQALVEQMRRDVSQTREIAAARAAP